VRVNLLRVFAFVKVFELLLNVHRRVIVRIATWRKQFTITYTAIINERTDVVFRTLGVFWFNLRLYVSMIMATGLQPTYCRPPIQVHTDLTEPGKRWRSPSQVLTEVDVPQLQGT